jgi:phosphoglycerate dehydrogenase-like enzyme
MNILFTTENGPTKEIYFPVQALRLMETLGNITYNETDIPFTQAQLAKAIEKQDVCLTHWDCPSFTEDVLEHADRLKLIVHAAGSVADLVTAQVYDRGIRVCSANTIMAKYVAEGVLAYILAGLRWIPQHAFDLQHKKVWRKRSVESNSLIGVKMGLIGLGTIGRFLIDLLEPFDVQIKIYDPYISADSLKGYPNVELAALKDVLSWGDVISIHASLTKETHGLLDKNRLKLIKEGALLVNTARGAIVDEKALADELRTGRFRAVLDVYETEPLPLDSPLRDLDNVILQPHVAGIPAREQMSYAMIEEIGRFSKGEPLQFRIPYEKFILMTKEH